MCVLLCEDRFVHRKNSTAMRRYVAKDLEPLIAIIRDHLEADVTRHIGPWAASEDMLREAIPKARDNIQVVENAGVIAGFLWVEHRDNSLYLEEIHVVESARGTGLGRKLMDEAERTAMLHKQSEIRLSVFRDSPAVHFYKRLGFEAVGEDPHRNQLHLCKAIQSPRGGPAVDLKLTYRDVDFDSREDCELLASWYNDPAIKHLYSRFTDAERFSKDFTPEYFQRVGQNPPTGGPHGNLMVLVDGVPIGQATFETDTPKLLTKTTHTAWIALLVGDDRLRRCGLGTRIIAHLEKLAADSGAERIETGVFEYNERALSFFTSLGYDEFGRRPDHVWWDGRMWSDVRLLKTL